MFLNVTVLWNTLSNQTLRYKEANKHRLKQEHLITIQFY